MTTEKKKETTKKHLMKMIQINGFDYEKAIEENFKYFDYLKQPAKIADAISRVI